MPRFASAVLALLAVNGFAASIHHKHQHQHHEKRVNFDDPNLYKDVDWAEVFGTEATTKADTPAAAATSAVAAVAAPVKAVVKEATADTTGDSTGFGGISTPVSSDNVDTYIGNVGVPYGSNIIKAASASAFDYTITMKNSKSSPIKVIVWNKSGPDGQANSGQFSTPALSFPLAAGASQVVAFDKNTQGAFCSDTGKKTAWGANDCTFGEFDFDNESNGGWSGYDVSSIQNTDGNSEALSISSPNGATSSNTGNNYVSDTQAGGIGGNLAPGPQHLTAVWS